MKTKKELDQKAQELLNELDKPTHSPLPWSYLPPIGEGTHGVMCATVNQFGNFYAASCNQAEDAAFIVKCVNAHEALLAFAQRVSHNCTLAPEWKREADKAIAKAEKGE